MLTLGLSILAATITIAPSTGIITIDGHLDEPAWQDAATVTEFFEVMPGDNTEPPVKTEACITYDRKNLYIAFKCYDPEPELIRAHLGDHDSAFGDDRVGIMIDTFNDQRRGYEFFANIMGVQTDILRSETTGEDSSWDTIWDAAGQFTDFGYTIEVAIPFKSLRFQDKEEQIWGISLFRDYHRNIRHQIASSRYDKDNNCFICQWDTLKGLRDIKPGRNIEIIPSLTVQRNDFRSSPDEPIVQGDDDVEGSLNFMWGITPEMTLNAAINPDFSQVESDVMQMDINTRFALHYPEKRPFFMEGSDIFSTPFSILYTRSIADPDWGVKLTGKKSKTTYGIMAAQDNVANFLIPANQYSSLTSWDEKVTSGVFRFSQDIGEKNMIGLIGTHRAGGSYHNSVLGVDGRFYLTDSDLLNFQWFFTDTTYPDNEEVSAFNGEELDGEGLHLEYIHSTKEWDWHLSYSQLDPEVRTDLGFEPRVDLKQSHACGGHTWWGEKDSFFTRLRLHTFGNLYHNFDNEMTDREYGAEIYAEMPLQTSLETGLMNSFVLFNGKEYEFTWPWLWVSMRPNSSLHLYTELLVGDFIDFSNERMAKRFDYKFETVWKPVKRVEIYGSFAHRELYIDEGDIFTAELYILRVNYHFNRRSFIRALIQYQDVERNPELYLSEVNRKDRAFSSQLLFSYRINPFTLVYLGYSDRGYEDDWVDRTTTNRSYFLKLSYAFRP